MKIAFWSNSPGKSGVTSNLACMSILSAMYQPSETVLFENHSNITNLGNTFLNKNSHNILEEEHSYFVENGLGRVLSFCTEHHIVNAGMLYRTCLSVFDQQVFYLPTGGMNRDLMEYRLNHYVEEVLNLLEQHFQHVCVDLSSSSLESTRRILQCVDMVVVNLCQNQQILSHFFQNYSEIQKKAFYVIGNYDSDSVINKCDIVGRYHLNGCSVGTIPYNRRFADALTKGEIATFLLRHYGCGREDVNYDFICAVKETICMYEKGKEEIMKKRRKDCYEEKVVADTFDFSHCTGDGKKR